MTVLVPIKCVRDPDNADKVDVTADGHRVETNDLELQPNPFDEYALEAALRLLETGVGTGVLKDDITLVTLGLPMVEKPLRQCLAMGAQEGIRVEVSDTSLDALRTAQVLAAVTLQVSAKLVLMGKQSVDGDSGQVPAMLAALLGWPLITGVNAMTTDGGMDRLTLTSAVDGGTCTVETTMPAVVSVDLGVVSASGVTTGVAIDATYHDGPRYTPLRAIMKARKKTLRQIAMDSLNAVSPQAVRYVRFEKVPRKQGAAMVTDVNELVRVVTHAISGGEETE